MNNDISRDITCYNKMQSSTGKIEQTKIEDTASSIEIEHRTSAMDCLGAMGHAMVNMVQPSKQQKTVKNSVQEFCNDPFDVDVKNDFCDNLINKRGYTPWQAMNITDRVFEVLKEKETYRN